LTIVPWPRQTLQVLVRMNWPKPPRLETSRMRPLPLHCGHVSRPVPALAPLPLQSSQAASAVTSTSRAAPNTASRSSSSTRASTSSPRGVGALPAVAPQGAPPASRSTESNMPLPPKNTLKRSLKPNWLKSIIGRPLRPSKP
jgi:hypothetical protein